MLVRVKPTPSSHSRSLFWKQIIPVYKQKLLESPVIANNVEGIEIKLKVNESKGGHLQSRPNGEGAGGVGVRCVWRPLLQGAPQGNCT